MSLKNRGLLFFLIAIATLYAAIDPIYYLSTRPHGDHAWAQCDRASWALNYYQYQAKFGEPQTHNIVYNNTGIATGEFPAIPYLVSGLYKTFGYNEYLFRLTTLLLTLPAFIFSFMLAKKHLNHIGAVLVASLLWVCSPNLIFYSIGFLPDSVALSFFTAGLYFLLSAEQLNLKSTLLFIVFTSVAVLLKSSVLFLVAAVYISLLVTQWRTNEFKRTAIVASAISIVLFVCLAWLLYARICQISYHSNVFKVGMLLPHSTEETAHSLGMFIRNLPKLYPVSSLFILLVLMFVWLSNFNWRNFFHVFTLTGGILWVVFFIFMFRNAGHHGYYHVPFQVLIFTLSLSALQIIEKSITLYKNQIIAIGCVSILSFYLYTGTVGKISSHYDLIDKSWLDLEPTLRGAGIKPTDKVFTAYDGSYNISLYLMNQRGWNSMPDVWDNYNHEGLKQCTYAVFTNDSIAQNTVISGYIDTLIATHKNLIVYRLKH